MIQDYEEAPVEAPAELVPVRSAGQLSEPLRILYATDGSEPARAAGRLVAQLPLPEGSTVRLVTVLADDTWEIPPFLRGTEREWALQNFQQAENLLARPGVAVRHSLLFGDPAHEIIREAQATGADLIVLGTHGRTGLTGVLLGSVAVNVAKHARHPVLVVRGAAPGLRRVILAVDSAEHSKQAAKLLARLPLPSETQVTVCHVVRPYTPFMELDYTPSVWEAVSGVRRQQVLDAEQLTGSVAAELKQLGLLADGVVREGDPADELTQLAAEQGADLIVAGARGLSAIQALLVGSVADRLLRKATCSVLIVHPA